MEAATKIETRSRTPRLGLVCITHTDAVRYKTVTRKRLLQFDAVEQKRMLRALYAANLACLGAALDFCVGRGLRLYRMTSGLFPFADDSAEEILEVCGRAGVPMVFDAHHHVVHEGLDSYDHPSVAEMVEAARGTWPTPEWQLVHISNGRESFRDRHHSDLVTHMPAAYARVPWIEVEAKHKELAIEHLRAN